MRKIPEDFGQRLKAMRESHPVPGKGRTGLSIRELARQCGMHFTMIADYEAGRRFPSRKSLEKLACALGLSGEGVGEFVVNARKDARMNKTKQDFPLIPNAIQKRLLEEISKALRTRGVIEIREIYDHPECDLMWVTDKDEWFAVEIATVSGRSEREALHKLSKNLHQKANLLKKQKNLSEGDP
jgi:transcriptional regulator with XRE-family HTH domain